MKQLLLSTVLVTLLTVAPTLIPDSVVNGPSEASQTASMLLASLTPTVKAETCGQHLVMIEFYYAQYDNAWEEYVLCNSNCQYLFAYMNWCLDRVDMHWEHYNAHMGDGLCN